MELILFAIPFFLLAMGLEYYVGYRRKENYYSLNDTLCNLCIGVGNQAIGIFVTLFLLGLYMAVYEYLGVFKEALAPSWYSALLCFIGFDFLYYWAHRWSHEWNFLWAAHVVHHQSEEYNLSVALRQSWFHNLLAFFVFLPLAVLGFSAELFIPIAGLVTLYQFWIHTKAIKRMPAWFEYIFNTPSHHRVHHAVDPKYIDKNHAATFILWDRLFGTFAQEEEEPSYGITSPLRSWSPTWANLHHFFDMYALARKAKRGLHKLYILVAPPGWRPKDLGGQMPIPEVDKNRQKFDTQVPAAQRLYAILQFSGVLLGLVAFMAYFEQLSWFYRLNFLALILLSLSICGAILEQRYKLYFLEYIRIVWALSLLNSLYYLQFSQWFGIMLLASLALASLSLWSFYKSTRSLRLS